MQSMGEKRNEYRHLFLQLVQYGTKGKCCKDFCVTLLNGIFILMSIFNWTLQSFPLPEIACDRPALLTLESQSQKVLGLLCAELHCNTFSSIARWRKHCRPDFTVLVLESTLSCSSGDWDISAPSDSDTDNHSDDVTCTNFTQWLTVQTVDLLYLYSTGLQGVRVGHDKQSHPTSTHFPTVVFWQQTNDNKLLPWANYKDLTQATTDTGLCNKREFGAVCVSPKTSRNEI
jgi:hypothetical protein